MSDWFRPLDPTGGIPGLRSRYVPRGTEPPPPVAKPARRRRRPRAVVAAPDAPVTPVPDDVLDVPALTVRERIVAALGSIERERPRTALVAGVALGDLVVRAWTLWPESFGLAGHSARPPDSNRVLAKLSGVDGVVAQGWVRRVGAGRLRLTGRGERWFRRVGASAVSAAMGGAR